MERHVLFSEEERRALADSITRIRTFSRGDDLFSEGVQTSECLVLLSGVACRYKILQQGGRQILSFHIPGDVCEIQSLWLPINHNVAAMSDGRGVLIPHASLRSIIGRHPRIGEALWRLTLVDGAMSREWLVGMGRRSSLARISHLLCELRTRHEAAGLLKGEALEWPITQADLADALGLSAVHVNRVLQRLRARGLVTLNAKSLVVNDWHALSAAGEFAPHYLHLK